ncbi:hypothetical protein NN561_010598 [Cricetulus griseus]
MRRACGERGGATPAPELWACALRSGGERASLLFYFPAADHVENNNSLGPGQRQLVLLGVPSAAAGSSARGFRARVHPQQCTLAGVRARCAAQRQPAPRRGSAKGHRSVYPRLQERGGGGRPVWERLSLARGETSRPRALQTTAKGAPQAPELGLGPGDHRSTRRRGFHLSELTQGTPSRGRQKQCEELDGSGVRVSWILRE